VISQPIDVLGVNYYTVNQVRSDPASPGHDEYPGTEGIAFPAAEAPVTEMGWGIHPEGLESLLVRLSRDYPGTPLMVTENGVAFDDKPDADGALHDPDRIAYLDGHFRAAHAAMERGADLRGYFVWSLLDNFEWAHGYHKRFGLVRVDFTTQHRTPKSSARWYRDVITHNGLR
jgi:beta-glucosidase